MRLTLTCLGKFFTWAHRNCSTNEQLKHRNDSAEMSKLWFIYSMRSFDLTSLVLIKHARRTMTTRLKTFISIDSIGRNASAFLTGNEASFPYHWKRSLSAINERTRIKSNKRLVEHIPCRSIVKLVKQLMRAAPFHSHPFLKGENWDSRLNLFELYYNTRAIAKHRLTSSEDTFKFNEPLQKSWVQL